MMDWDKLRVFHTVATALSFTRAGETLGISQSAISRQISALEEHLKVALFHRHARGLMLTEQGEILFKTVNDILGKLVAAENALLETREQPQGPLKITAPLALGTVWLAPLMGAFREGFPDIHCTLLVDDRELDLIMREADVAIRLYPARHPDLIQKHIATLKIGLYASNEYVKKHGTPKKVEELSEHALITFPEETKPPYADVNWISTIDMKGREERGSVLKINSLVGIQQAVMSGAGIAGLPEYMMRGVKNVTKLLPNLKSPSVDVYLIYPLELRNSRRIKVFRDFLIEHVAQSDMQPTA